MIHGLSTWHMLFAGARLHTARVDCAVPVAVLSQHARVQSECLVVVFIVHTHAPRIHALTLRNTLYLGCAAPDEVAPARPRAVGGVGPSRELRSVELGCES